MILRVTETQSRTKKLNFIFIVTKLSFAQNTVNMSGKRYFDNKYEDYCANNSAHVINSETGILKCDITNKLLANIKKLLLHLQQNYQQNTEPKDYSVYTGLTGIALLYLNHYSTLASIDDKLLEKCVSIVDPIIKHIRGRDYSFICGDSGPVVVSAIANHRINNSKQCPKLLNSLKSMISYAKSIDNDLPDEMLYGRSGFLYSLLMCRKHIPNSEQIITDADIRGVVDAILRSGVRTSQRNKSMSPLMYYWHNSAYIGAAHGLIGIMFMLLQSRQYLTDHELDKLVKPTIDFIVSLRMPSGNYPSSLGNSSDKLVHWCHGSPGAVHLFASAYQIFGDNNYLSLAKQCCDDIWVRGLLTKGYGICHGTAGNGYAFLKLYQITNEQKYLYRAIKFGEWCCDYGSHGCRIADRPFSLFEGLAGTIHFMVDLLNAKNAHFPAFDLG